MASEILRADGKYDPAVFENLFCGKIECAGKRSQMERRILIRIRHETDTGKPPARAALPLRFGKFRLMRTMPGAIPDNRVVQLISFFNPAAIAVQLSIPEIDGMIMAARIQILVSPVDAEIKFHKLSSRID